MKHEAKSIIKELQLLEIAQKHGTAMVVGSVELDLLVKPDIDIHILTNQENIEQVASTIAQDLLLTQKIDAIRINYYRDLRAIHVAADNYQGPSHKWSIDMWVTHDPARVAFAKTAEFKKLLTKETRAAIMTIKKDIYQKGQLRNGMSTKIYEAVLYTGVQTIEEFEKTIA